VREPARTVRLPTDLVDRVMSGVSDMILARNELERQLSAIDTNLGVDTSFNRLAGILSELQQAMTRARMQPIGALFSSFQRLVRDLSAELGKRVEVDIESGQVELDREMIEFIRDPLLHIVRNALDHGIESPAERRLAGKPETGLLKFSARQTGNEIRIGIIDDGRGIDTLKVVDKAIAKGLLTPEQAESLTARQRNALICEPGLSSSAKVTHLSGRGVGMDIVRASIERLGGKLKIDTTPGQGSRILLDVPLTLSIVPSITVRVGEHVFALPRSYVDEIVRNNAAIEGERIGGLRHVTVRDELRPCVSLSEVLGLEESVPATAQTLVMMKMIDGSIFALGIDAIVDHGDLVVRPVSPHIIDTNLYVGVAQLDDGKPALMIDVAGLAATAGLVLEVQGRSTLDLGSHSGLELAPKLTQVIVFNGLDGLRKAVPISAVERLFEVSVSEIGQGGGGPHIVYEDQIFPLHGLKGALPEAGALDVLLLHSGAQGVAFATNGQVDAAEIDLATATGSAGKRVALLGGATVELIDGSIPDPWSGLSAPASAAPSCRLPTDDRWCREFLLPQVAAAGYRIVEDRDSRVDLEIVLDLPAATSPLPALADDVLVIASNRKRVKQGGKAVHRDDRDALAAVLRSARQGRQA
jgi:two-component system chemotaxis sensor kinase CheA